MSDSEGDFGGMFDNAEEQEQERQLLEERNKIVPIQVPRFGPNGDEAPALSLIHRPAQSHSLWGNLLWNAARHLVYLMDTGKIRIKGRTVLELGCGVAAPSIVAALQGARMVAATDYPDEALLRVVAENAAKVLVVDESTCMLQDAEQEEFAFDKMDERIKKEALEMMPEMKEGETAGEKEKKETKEKEDDEDGEEKTKKKKQKRLPFVVEGLCWGNEGDITRVLDKTGLTGFDVIFLSDLLFNHICHDTLLATVSRMLSRDTAARAYVTFSFHRAHKRLDDLRFFDKCAFYGIRWTLLETNDDYPLMFPDDPGDPSVRKPVYLYELALTTTEHQQQHHTGGGAGAAAGKTTQQVVDVLDKFRYDVVVQGTGIVETLVSASCARAGLSVLHLDAQSLYGGGFFSGRREDLDDLLGNRFPARTCQIIETPCSDRLEEIVKLEQQQQQQQQKAREKEEEEKKGDEQQVEKSEEQQEQKEKEESEAVFSLRDAKSVLGSRQLTVDAFTTPFLASSTLIDAIAHSQMADHVEFQNVHRIVGLKASSAGSAAPPKVFRVPVTRKDVFNNGIGAFSPLECRRLMRFVQDLTDRSALEKDTDVHRERHSDEIVDGLQQKHPALDLKATSLGSLLAKQYSFSPALFDLITLGGALVQQGTPTVDAVPVIFSYLSSIGRYGGVTPYLAPMYSASDLPQIFARMSAVWGSVFALERSAVGVVRMAESGSGLPAAGLRKELLSAGAGEGATSSTTAPIKNDISLPASPGGARIVLDNGQHVHAKCLVVPRRPKPEGEEEEEDDTKSPCELVRCIIVSKKPIVSWALLEATCSDAALNEDDAKDRMELGEPLAVGFASFKKVGASVLAKNTNSGAAAADTASSSLEVDVSASFCQWTELLQSAPRHIYTTHITAPRYQKIVLDKSDSATTVEISPASLLRAVRETLFVAEPPSDAGSPAVCWSHHVVLGTAFLWGETLVAECAAARSSAVLESKMKEMKGSVFSSSIFDAAADLAKERDEKQQQQQPGQKENEELLKVLEVKTLFSELNDNLYAKEAERVFRQALRACGRNDDAKEMPIIKGKPEGEKN